MEKNKKTVVDNTEKDDKEETNNKIQKNSYQDKDKQYEKNDREYHLSDMSIIELNGYITACSGMINYYEREYQINKNDADAKNINRYSIIFRKIVSEIDKRFGRLCE